MNETTKNVLKFALPGFVVGVAATLGFQWAKSAIGEKKDAAAAGKS